MNRPVISDRNSFDILVIGGGPAGITAALRSCELGASVALVEKGLLGGACTNDGCVPTRVLAKAARLKRDSEQFKNYGLMGDSPEVDLARLLKRAQRTVYRMHEKKQLIQHLEDAGAQVWAKAGCVRFADPHTVLLEKEGQLRAEKIIIATGGHARLFSFPGSEYVITHSDVWSLDKLPRAMAVVGASSTGCQIASIFASFGAQVSLFNRGPRILPSEDQLVAHSMSEAFRARGIDVVTEFDVQRIEKEGKGLRLFYTRLNESHSLAVDAVVLAVGWEGNLAELNLAAAGVNSEHGYVAVNDYLQTSVPHIFAAGDVTGRMMLVQSSGYEGRLAAENAILGMGQSYKHQIVPHGGFTDPEYAGVGLTEDQARAQGECLAVIVPFREVDRAVIDDRTQGACKLIVSQETHRILGAHIVGEQALEAIQLVAAAIAADMWVEQLAELELAYPTYTAIVGLAARRLCQDLGVVPMASAFRSLGRGQGAEWESEWSEA